MCRRSQIPAPKYKVTITVENTETTNVSVEELVTELLMERFQGEINFETETLEEIYHVISSIGLLRRVDIDSLVLHTE
jgi:hypothetical protein